MSIPDERVHTESYAYIILQDDGRFQDLGMQDVVSTREVRTTPRSSRLPV